MTITNINLTSDNSSLLVLERGIPGFPNLSELRLQPVDDYGIFVWLAAADNDEVSFLAVNPFVYFGDYEVSLSDADEKALEADTDDEVIVYCLVTLNREDRTATANLLAPIVVNATRKIATQVILEGEHDLRAPLPVPDEDEPEVTS